jgi:hypothetical protein
MKSAKTSPGNTPMCQIMLGALPKVFLITLSVNNGELNKFQTVYPVLKGDSKKLWWVG